MNDKITKETFTITGMTCDGCVNRVKQALSQIAEIITIDISLANGELVLESKNEIPFDTLKQAVSNAGNYTLSKSHKVDVLPSAIKEVPPIYKRLFPLFLVFSYLIGFVVLRQTINGEWDTPDAMRSFMGSFFIVFSFFKFLDIRGFAYSFSSYDPIAKRWLGYGYLYPFIELILGISYISEVNPLITNVATLLILSLGTIGVVDTLRKRENIKCACLGTIFNLPMTKVTLIENGLMIMMALLAILYMV